MIIIYSYTAKAEKKIILHAEEHGEHAGHLREELERVGGHRKARRRRQRWGRRR